MRGLLIIGAVLFFAFALTGMAGAAGCTDDSQIIFRLSSTDNAHGAIWNQTYGIKVCYNEIFGTSFKGSNPHSCSSDSRVLRLYSETNSHAAAKDSTSYPVDVCYAGIGNCTINQEATCNDQKKAVIYLSSLTNAHLSKSYSAGFYAVCCSNTTAEESSGPTNCIEYITQDDCINYDFEVAQVGCPEGKSCFCEWNAAGKCLQAYASETQDCSYKCSMTPTDYQSAVCKEDGYKTVSVSATIIPINGCSSTIQDPKCINREVEVPCGLVGFDLPFFGFWQFAAGLSSIIFIYLLIKRT